jgi:hypothetical protein
VGGEGLGEVLRSLAQRQTVMGGPEIQRVALGLALGVEAAEKALAQVDRERAVAVAGRVVQGTGPTPLKAQALQRIEVAEMPEHPLHRHLATQRGKVQQATFGASPVGGRLGVAEGSVLAAGGLTEFLPPLTGRFELAVALAQCTT